MTKRLTPAALVELGDTFIQFSQDNAFGQGSAAGFYNVVKAAGGKFVKNDAGKVTKAIHHQGGRTLDAPKVE